MAIGKNKKLSKRKGGKKKTIDPFTKKDWYDVRAPSMFSQAGREFGKTLVTRTAGGKIASECLKGRVFEVSLADLNKMEDEAYRKMKLKVEDVSGRHCLTNFYGMSFTSDRLRSLSFRKWQTLIECVVDVKTTDGYLLRLFCIGFTRKAQYQHKKTCYAKSSQIRAIRAKMHDIMVREATTCDLKQLVEKFIPESIGKEIEKACTGIYPLHQVHIRKVKTIRSPRFDAGKLMELHADFTPELVGQSVPRPAAASE